MSGSARGPLRRTRADLIGAGAVAAVAALALGGAWLGAPIRGVEHSPAADAAAAVESPARVPDTLSPVFELADAPVPGHPGPLIADGSLITNDGHTVTARTPDGEEIWSYGRPEELCSLGAAWDDVVAVYRTGVGCGDAVSLDAATGEYDGTRSAIASEAPLAVSSNDRVGVVGADRVELWRSDMVRTVEYGRVEAKQEPDLQPHEGCTITSALTRTDMLAITETCPDDPSASWLRFQETTPEDARAPEIIHERRLPDPAARLVAVGQDGAAVYLSDAADDSPRLLSVAEDGSERGSRAVPQSPALADPPTPFMPATADLPHHMSWFDGQRLYLLTPETLLVDHVFEDAVGAGAAVGDLLLYPTAEGLAVADGSTGDVRRVIPVDRGDYTGPVFVGLAGETVVEKRGDRVVGLR